MEYQETANSQNDPENEEKIGRLTLPNFSIHYKATVIKTVQHWREGRRPRRWDRTENPGTNPHLHGQTRDKGARSAQWVRGSLFPERYRKTGYPHATSLHTLK